MNIRHYYENTIAYALTLANVAIWLHVLRELAR